MEFRKVHFSDVVEHEQIQKRTFTNWINAQLAKRSVKQLVPTPLDGDAELLTWSRSINRASVEQNGLVHCTANVKDFKSSWRSGEAFLAILCSLRPELVDLSRVQTRSNQENLEEAFHLAERELHIPRLLEPQDVDVKDPDEKSIMTYVAQFLQYSNDLPSPDDHLQKVVSSFPPFGTSHLSGDLLFPLTLSFSELVVVQLFPLEQPSGFSSENLHAHFAPAAAISPLHPVSLSDRVQDMIRWLQQACKELSKTWTATEGSNYAEKYQVYKNFTASFAEQRRSVMKLLAAARRRSELNQEQQALRTAWDQLEEELWRCEADLERSLPPPLDSVVLWLQRGEAALKDEGEMTEGHAEAAKHARAKQDKLKTLIKEMNHYVTLTDSFHSVDDSGSVTVPSEKLDDIKNRLTGIRVTTKYEIIKLEYEESHHTVLDLLGVVKVKVQSWRTPYGSQQSVQVLLLDWHETVERRGLLLILTDALQSLKGKMDVYTRKASLGGDLQSVTRQVKEAESESELVKQMTAAAKEMMERVAFAWDVYNKNLTSLETWLVKSSAAETRDVSEWSSCHAQLNEAGNLLIEMTEASISSSLVEQLSKVNLQWAERMKKTVFVSEFWNKEIQSEPKVGSSSVLMLDSLTQEAGLLLRQPLEVASVPLKAVRQKLQVVLVSWRDVPDSHPQGVVVSLSAALRSETAAWLRVGRTQRGVYRRLLSPAEIRDADEGEAKGSRSYSTQQTFH
ncbi:hypothetical protein CCH79_00000557 [Gambusia affinis]|uniref:Calponin-homology (CH) domain-containing protein n=1 Tax=Gambusia affinis TaxID=33528 RepID=A0A315VYB3_GAMAF|nr:hypothetical protein CCH79_00000557 [Gambusia affinis]